MSSYTPEQKALLESAAAAVESAKQAVWQAEEALIDAKRALSLAEGRHWIAKDRPTWKQIFVPGVIMQPHELYTYCMQTGYSYALWNGKVFKAGRPAEQMIDTGALEADIK
jgi:hypothetical protein